jgi:uncharacterized heparinase superfamily protein
VPLVGDTDGGQVLPIASRNANDRAHLLALGAVEFRDSQLKLPHLAAPPELLWLFGEYGLQFYSELPSSNGETSSQAFSDSGNYVMRHDDLFLLFNANGAQARRPASHRHNDVLSVEVSACGRAFIVDPGTFVYTANLHERHLFRSTAYHSTVQIDDEEQNTILEAAPFAFGDEKRARVLVWESTAERDRVAAEHTGYQRLANPVTHRRAVSFDKARRWWLIEDELMGKGEHKIAIRFHFDTGLDVKPFENNAVIACDPSSDACLLVRSLDLDQLAELQPQYTSRQYGAKAESTSACWTITTSIPCKLRWALIPSVQSPTSKVQSLSREE